MNAMPVNATLHFPFVPPFFFSWGSTLKGKNLPLLEQILSFKSRPLLRKVTSSKEVNGKSSNFSPFLEMAVKQGRCSHSLLRNAKCLDILFNYGTKDSISWKDNKYIS